MSLSNRYDFVLLFEVKDGNPNGDPDAGNLPRLDAETGHGLVTDVSLKRKVRNFIALLHQYSRPYDIYVKEKAVLGRSHVEAFDTLGISLGEEGRQTISEEQSEALQELGLPDGLSVDEVEEGKFELVTAADIDKKAVQDWIKESKPNAALKKLLTDTLKKSKGRKPTQTESENGKKWLCQNFFDIRTFGAVLSLKSAPNCGQVRGPVQLTFARSVDPIIAQEHSITRMAVATEAEAEKQGGDNRTMGRKHTVPYGLYVAHGFVSSFLAKQTGFSDADLELLWQALSQMFDHDRSAARGEMATRGLYVFKHESELGNAPAHTLFERIQVVRKADVPRSFADYEVAVNEAELPSGVALLRMV
ncbi:type I-C CRISPR-associated protein Cas7/Csd2 [Acidithiobacillus sulfuriphilus]|uniref:Type I-C CRISPR-associated protein Cas7/Csd2 n=2 Tax=Acidithiobacillus sulfuriphilus TaxID=1867749 RepID=A0A3M8QZG9_9PROT|nr:type I-C CRISPR-associated protein Cas7/Csd2 [Acidithiobacillus sulfuriphilus]RNF61689.1 type I-C CRISPR-associated protein Cas7/Csd2 [Acidithiobacillus sulfuriphilus]